MAYETLILERRGGVATVTLNRPEALNALSLALGRDLFHVTLELDDDPAVRCIVITGRGKAFCAGGDVKDFVDQLPRIGAHIKELTTYLHGAVSRLIRSPKPVIMAINGVAAGGGLSFALSGDIVIAAESARLTMAYSKIAATPDGSSSYFLPRLIGLRRALALYLTNRVLSAREALEGLEGYEEAGHRWLDGWFGGKFPIVVSLAVIGAALATSVLLSLVFPKRPVRREAGGGSAREVGVQ